MTTTAKKLAESGLAMRTVRMGDTLRVYVMKPEDTQKMEPLIEAEIKRALNRGQTVEEDGIQQWIEEIEVRDSSKSGSEAYTWHPDGNRIWVEKKLVTKFKDGAIVRQPAGFVWRKW